MKIWTCDAKTESFLKKDLKIFFLCVPGIYFILWTSFALKILESFLGAPVFSSNLPKYNYQHNIYNLKYELKLYHYCWWNILFFFYYSPNV